jgi:hypothetical protein
MVCLAAIQIGELPQALKRISIVEVNHERAMKLRKLLSEFLMNDRDAVPLPSGNGFRLPTAIMADKSRRKVFVAMSFGNTDDTYLFGIQRPIVAAGFLPVRIDKEYFSGDVFADIQKQIRRADLVVADLSYEKPNVYLEVGYALAKNKGPILLKQKGHKAHFDVQGLKWIEYQTPEDLRVGLAKAINQHIARKAVAAKQDGTGSTSPAHL